VVNRQQRISSTLSELPQWPGLTGMSEGQYLREVGVVMAPCRASRKRLNQPLAYHDRESPFPNKEQNSANPVNSEEPLANTSFFPPPVLNYRHAVGIALSPLVGLKYAFVVLNIKRHAQSELP
jgi:hypothetical protein